MDEIVGVHELQCFGNLFNNSGCFLFVERRPLIDKLLEIAELHKLHGEIKIVGIFIPTVKLDKALLILAMNLETMISYVLFSNEVKFIAVSLGRNSSLLLTLDRFCRGIF